MLERAAILSNGPEVRIEDTLSSGGSEPAAGSAATLEDAERAHIVRTLERTRWVIEGKDGAAALLGLRPSTLRSRMQKLGIRRGADPEV